MANVRRMVVVGGPGSGKTTVAAALARRFELKHIELDALWWQPGWTSVDRPAFRQSVKERLLPGAWVADGNYFDEIADFVWTSADTIIWLDLPRHVAIVRALSRSGRRVMMQRPLWSGNREPASVLTPMSIARLIWRWPSYAARISSTLSTLEIPDTVVMRLTSDDAVARWLASLAA